jgi:hypothetical protein
MLNDLIGKKFELTEIIEAGIGNAELVSLTFVGDDEVVRLEADLADYGETPLIRVSVESLVEPLPEQPLMDVFCGAFVAQ